MGLTVSNTNTNTISISIGRYGISEFRAVPAFAAEDAGGFWSGR